MQPIFLSSLGDFGVVSRWPIVSADGLRAARGIDGRRFGQRVLIILKYTGFPQITVFIHKLVKGPGGAGFLSPACLEQRGTTLDLLPSFPPPLLSRFTNLFSHRNILS